MIKNIFNKNVFLLFFIISAYYSYYFDIYSVSLLILFIENVFYYSLYNKKHFYNIYIYIKNNKKHFQ